MRTRLFAATVMAMGSIASAAGRLAAAQERSPAPGSAWTVTVTPTLNPSLLAFASPADQAAQEEKIRKINFTGTRAKADYVPQALAAPVYTPGLLAATLGFSSCP